MLFFFKEEVGLVCISFSCQEDLKVHWSRKWVGSFCSGQFDGPAVKSTSFYVLLSLSCMSSAGYLQGSAFTSDQLSSYFSRC